MRRGLQQAGHQVTSWRAAQGLQKSGSMAWSSRTVATGIRSSIRVATTDKLSANDAYDLAMIVVRYDQLPSILPSLAANKMLPTVLFMLNNPLGSAHLVDAVGLERVLLGFPGAGGVLQDHVVRYALISQQPTTIGEPRGVQTDRPKFLAESMRAAGFPARIDSDMDGWLSSHAFFVTSVCAAIYLAGGDCKRLSRDRHALELMVEAVREGFTAVRKLGLASPPNSSQGSVQLSSAPDRGLLLAAFFLAEHGRVCLRAARAARRCRDARFG